MKTVIIQLYPNSEFSPSIELETSHLLTEQENEDTRSTLEKAYGPIDPDSPAPSFFAFQKSLSELNPELANQLMSIISG